MNTESTLDLQNSAPLPPARGSASGALADGVWKAAKDHELAFNDIIDACAILIEAVAKNVGVPPGQIAARMIERMKLVRPNDEAQRP